jgi:tryptophanase
MKRLIQVYHPFKGNIDLHKLENVFIENPKEKIPFIVMTVTCNTAGGQPVSMENIKAVSKLCKSFGIKMLFDSARYAENCYFIKEREAAYKDIEIKAIAKEMFSYGDGMTMSAKKDGLVNMGVLLPSMMRKYTEQPLHSILCMKVLLPMEE